MANETNIFSFGESADPVEKARAALRAVRQYEQDWQEHGVNRVHQYYDDVEGDWLENFGKTPMEVSLAQISNVSFSDIVTQLKSLGLSKSFIERAAFPSWWKREFEGDKNEISKLLVYLVERFSLKIDFLEGPSNLSLDFLPVSTKFKLQKKQENPSLFSNLSRSVAKVVAPIVDYSYRPIENSALAIRQSILQNHSCVSLNSLLSFCWEVGIPVVHFDEKPNGHVKSDGLVVMVEGRPVIIIGSSRKQSAWLLFILAHELGHIANGDLQDGILVDANFVGGVIDQEEERANQFAKQLLFGDIALQWNDKLNRNSLLTKARQLSRTHRLDISSVVLNYAWQTGDWKCAMVALKVLEPNANAPAQINTYYQCHLVKIDADSREYLERMNVLAAAEHYLTCQT